MSNSDKAVTLMKNGFLCSQAVFSTLGRQLGMESKLSLRLATGLGAGIAGRGDICGAVSGGIMAIGLKHGNDDRTDVDARNKVFFLTQELIEKIKARYGCYTCRGLTGIDFTRPEGIKQAEERGILVKCMAVIRDTVETVEDIW